jgi:transposase
LEERLERLERENRRLVLDDERLRNENRELRDKLEEALRTAKRQAAPFAKQAAKEHPEKPGRKAGAEHGANSWRKIPELIDETLEAKLPAQCPECGGPVEVDKVADQYQTELPPIRPWHVRSRVQLGHCGGCGRHLQGRHERQTSNALGVAGSQLGPRAVATAGYLNKGLGLSHDKVRQLFVQNWGDVDHVQDLQLGVPTP